MAYGGKVRKMAQGGMMKPVDKEKNPGLAKLPTEVRNKMGFMKKGGMTKKKAPKGMHYMPDGKLMKDSAHKKKSKKMMYGGTVKKMKHGGMAKCKRDGIAMRGRTRAGK
jgi:hypothetical protein